MRTYALLSQKGGAGKSTLTRAFSVIAGEAGPSWIIDRDSKQATAGRWHQRRQEIEPAPEQPGLIDLEGGSLAAAVAALKSQPGTLFIDTRPAVEASEEEAARVADVILVPVRPSMDDLEAVGDTLTMVRKLGKRALLLVNSARNPRRAEIARAALSVHPEATCPHHVTDRAVFQDASVAGLGVGEMQGAAARDADAELRKVWTWVEEAGR